MDIEVENKMDSKNLGLKKFKIKNQKKKINKNKAKVFFRIRP